MSYLSLKDLRSGTVREFETEQVRLGRDPECELLIEGEGSDVVSGHHARFFFKEGKWWIEDAGSRNGTSLNDRHISHGTPEPVSPGATLGLGDRGPKFRVEATEKRRIAQTVIEPQRAIRPSAPTMPLEALNDRTLPVPGIDVGQSAPPKPRAAAAARPGPPPPSTLEIAVHDTRHGTKYSAKGGRVRLGRGDECELRPVAPGDTSVSRVHAEIILKDGKAILRDAKSRNGTFVDGQLLVGDHDLQPGERITLGEGGPDLLVDVLSLPGEARVSSEKSTARTAPDPGKLRRSFMGKGKTVFFREMMEETSKKSASRLRWVVWSFVLLLAATAGAFYWWSEQQGKTTTAAFEAQRQAMAAQRAEADSIRRAAAADYDRLRAQLDSARGASAPSAVLDSLRSELNAASKRTEAVEGQLKRTQTQLAQQLASGDSARKAAQADLARMRTELNRAASIPSQGSSAELDSLRAAIRQQERALRDQEQRNAEIAQQMRSRADTKDLLPMIAKESGPAIAIVTSMFCLHPSGQCNSSSTDTLAQPVWEDGTGFAITAGGYLVTNRHVVTLSGHQAQQVQVTLNNQMYPDQTLRADVMVVVPADGPDLAVLKIRNYRGPAVPKIDWTGTHVVQGEPAAALGFPAGMEAAIDRDSRRVSITMSRGIFAKVGTDRLRFDGFTIPGSSGSPVFNGEGEVVAVHFAGQAGEERRGLGSAVPIRLLVPYLPAEAKAELGLR